MKQDKTITVREIRNPPRHRPPGAFFMDDYYRPEVRELREKYGLEQKVAGARDRWEALLRLSNWIGGLNKFGAPPESVPLTALAILDAIINKGWNFECSCMPAVMLQVAHAMGYGARDVWCGYNGEIKEGGLHHGATEIWVDGLDKWVYVDALHRLHFERNGVPLSILELHNAACRDECGDVVCVLGDRRIPMPTGPEPETLNEVCRKWQAGEIPGPYPTPGLYFWFLVSMHNAHYANLHHDREMWGRVLFYRDQYNADKVWFQQLHPGTGARTYHWVYWATDPIEVWSEYQVNFPLNQVHIDWEPVLDRTMKLAFETTCPNFAHFRIEADGQPAVQVEQRWFTWALRPGANRLKVQAVNLFGVHGTASELTATL